MYSIHTTLIFLEQTIYLRCNTHKTFTVDKDGMSLSRAASHSTPGSCRFCRTGLVGAARVDKHVSNSIDAPIFRAIIEGSRQFGTPRTKVLIET